MGGQRVDLNLERARDARRCPRPGSGVAGLNSGSGVLPGAELTVVIAAPRDHPRSAWSCVCCCSDGGKRPIGSELGVVCGGRIRGR